MQQPADSEIKIECIAGRMALPLGYKTFCSVVLLTVNYAIRFVQCGPTTAAVAASACFGGSKATRTRRDPAARAFHPIAQVGNRKGAAPRPNERR